MSADQRDPHFIYSDIKKKKQIKSNKNEMGGAMKKEGELGGA